MAKPQSYQEYSEKKDLIFIGDELKKLPASVKDFIEARAVNASAKTRVAFIIDLKRFFAWWINATLSPSEVTNKTPEQIEQYKADKQKSLTCDDLENITHHDINDFVTYLQIDPDNSNSRSGVSRKLSSLSSYFGFLYKHDYIQVNPCDKVERPKLPTDSRIVRLTDEEVITVLDAIRTGCASFPEKQQKYLENTRARDYAIALLMLDTGIRVSECVGLDINDVNFNEKRIQITRKGGKKQYININDEVVDAIKQYLEIRSRCVCADDIDGRALFLSLQNKRLGRKSVEQMITKYATAAGVQKHITPHKLRKTYGTALYKESRDIYLVAGALGHSNVVTTTKHYVEQDEEQLREAADKIQFGGK